MNRFADHPWCAAAARLMRATATHSSFAPDAKTIGTTDSAQTSIAVFRAGVDRPAALDQTRGEPAAADAADVRDQVDGDERRAHRAQIDAVIAVEKVGHPEEVQPPDRIGQELPDRERPRLPMRHERAPRHRGRRHPPDRCGCARAPPRSRVDDVRGDRKSPTTAPATRTRARPWQRMPRAIPTAAVIARHDERRHQRADVGAGVEEAGRERALASRKPFGDGLDRGGKVSRLRRGRARSARR